MRVVGILACVAVLLLGCARMMMQYDSLPKQRNLEGVKIEVLDSYSDLGIFGIELKVENKSGQTVVINESQAVLVLSTGESIPPYVADETRSAFQRDVVYLHYAKWLGFAPLRRRALEGGSLHNGSWRTGALAFQVGAKVDSCKLMLSNMVDGYDIEPIGLVLKGEVKAKDEPEDKTRTFLGTKRTKMSKEKNEN